MLLGWAADTPDPDNFFSPLLSCTATFSGKNPANWCNPEFDLLLTKALDTTDLNLRKQYYDAAQSMIIKHHVMSIEDERDGLRLDWRWSSVLALTESALDGFAKGEGIKRNGHGCVGAL